MRVEAYRNLHQNCWSVRALEGPDKGRVIHRATTLRLSDCRFVVQPAGRNKVREQKKKNVHAFVRGTWGRSDPRVLKNCVEVTYNPYKHDTFVQLTEPGVAAHAADEVLLTFSPRPHVYALYARRN